MRRRPKPCSPNWARSSRFLRDADPPEVDTTLIVHPQVLQDFVDYNDFLGDADDLVEVMELDGVLQVASFHPQYQFADSDPDDIENFTNRSPYPTLHLLREDSVSRAVEAFPGSGRDRGAQRGHVAQARRAKVGTRY